MESIISKHTTQYATNYPFYILLFLLLSVSTEGWIYVVWQSSEYIHLSSSANWRSFFIILIFLLYVIMKSMNGINPMNSYHL
jgi:hypothetical protein